MAVSSKRNFAEVTGILNVGEIVQVKDKEWYDNLPVYTGEFRMGTQVEKWPTERCNIVFTEEMTRFLGMKMEVLEVVDDAEGMFYVMRSVDGSIPDSEIAGYSFINEMLVEC